MSNTLNTPIEALEQEFPMRVTEYSLRRGSGGAGRIAAATAIVREIEALEPMELLAAHRAAPLAPPRRGRRRPGRAGRNLLERAGGAPGSCRSRREGTLRAGRPAADRDARRRRLRPRRR